MEQNLNQKRVEIKRDYSIRLTSKQVRRLGFDLGYGITQGVFAAAFMTHVALGFVKAVRKHVEKKTGFEVKVEPDTEETSEESTAQ